MPYSGMWRHVDIVLTDILEECICRHLLMLVPRSWISYTLKMEAICSSETLVNTISTWRHIPEDCILQPLSVYEYCGCTTEICISYHYFMLII
jgi:hypothetical protein